jgi:hypothetical protein
MPITNKKTNRRVPSSPKAKAKMGKVMHEYKHHSLHIGKSKKIVRSRKQAIAIGLSQARKAARR